MMIDNDQLQIVIKKNLCTTCANNLLKMSDISQLKETLDQIQATQQTLVEKVDKLVAKSESLESLQKPCEVPQEQTKQVPEEPHEAPQEVPEEEPQEQIEEDHEESSEESEQETEKVAQEVPEQVPEESQEQSQEEPHEVPQEVVHDVPEHVSEESQEQSPEQIEQSSEEVAREESSQESPQVPEQVSQEVPQEKPEKLPEIDPLARIEEIPKEVREKTSEVNKYDLGDGLHYYEEDGICYIDVDKDDEIIDSVRAKIVSASLIRDYIKNGEFEKIKPYVPEDAYEALYKEYQIWERAQGHKLTEDEKKRIDEQQRIINAKTRELNDVLKQLAGRIAGWRRKQLIPRRDTLRKEIRHHKEMIEKIKRGGA